MGRPPGHPRGTQGECYSFGISFLPCGGGELFSFGNDFAGPRGHTHGICSRQWDRQGKKFFIWFDGRCVKMSKKHAKKLDTFVCYFCQWKVEVILWSDSKRLKKVVMLFLTTSKICYFFSQCMSGRNSTNPAIWLVPGVGGIFLSGPLSAGGIIKNVSSLSGNLSNDLCYYLNKNLSVKPLSSTWITSVFITICSLQIVQFVANLVMITALKCSGVSHAFRCVVEKNKNVIHQPRSVRIGKNCALCLEYRPRPASGGIQDLGYNFSQYGPPGWSITYIYVVGVHTSPKGRAGCY